MLNTRATLGDPNESTSDTTKYGSRVTWNKINLWLPRYNWSLKMDRASVLETMDSGSIPARVKPKTTETCIYSFPAWRCALKSFLAVW